MDIKTIRDIDLEGKRVFLRVDFNVPISGSTLTDDFKIVSALPTIRLLLSKKPKSVIIGSHLGRPDGKRSEAFSLRPVYNVLKRVFREELGLELIFCELDKIGTSDLWVFLENLRFNQAEESDEDPECVAEYRRFFTENADIAIVDAFGCLHRECGSIQRTGLPSYAGLLVEKELRLAKHLLQSKIDLIILGGKKVSSKIGLISSLGGRTRNLFIVGALAFPFLKYKLGKEIGTSPVDGNAKKDVKSVCEIENELGMNISLPVDFVALHKDQAFVTEAIPQDGVGLDIGPKTIKMLEEKISCANTIFWNGPPGVFEKKEFSKGTEALVQILGSLNKQGKHCFCGGGETASAVGKFGSHDKFAHVSTGGGALMQLLSGNPLPGLGFLEAQEE